MKCVSRFPCCSKSYVMLPMGPSVSITVSGKGTKQSKIQPTNLLHRRARTSVTTLLKRVTCFPGVKPTISISEIHWHVKFSLAITHHLGNWALHDIPHMGQLAMQVNIFSSLKRIPSVEFKRCTFV